MKPILRNDNLITKYFFLSPHYDDAVFSCGGLMVKAASAGSLVKVITFYAKQNNYKVFPPKLLKTVKKIADYNTRKNEDIAALNLLGAEGIHLDYIDRFFRPPWLLNLLQTFRTPLETNTGSFDNYESIKNYITKLVKNHPESYIFAPLGIGNHYDHVELFLSSITVAKECNALDRFFFYEDIYSLGRMTRRRHFLAKQIDWKWQEAPSYHSIIGIILDFIISSHTSGLSLNDYLPNEYSNLEWSIKTESIEGFIDKKIEAAAKYETQLKQFGGIKLFSKLLRHYHKFWGDAEPYWVANPIK